MISSAVIGWALLHAEMDLMHDDPDDILRVMVEIRNERGQAGGAAHNDNKLPGSKRMTEMARLGEWMKAASQQGEPIPRLVENRNDPPDAFYKIDGARKSVEAVEFVDGELIGALKKATRRERRRFTSMAGEGFHLAQRDKARFFKHLNEILDKKQELYEKRSLVIDVLVVSSAEPWLSEEDVRAWLARAPIEARANLQRVDLLLDDRPARPAGRYSGLRVYGSRTARAP